MRNIKTVLAIVFIFAASLCVGIGFADWFWFTGSVSFAGGQQTIGADVSVTTENISLAEAGLSFSAGKAIPYTPIRSHPITDYNVTQSQTTVYWSTQEYNLQLDADYSSNALLQQVPWDDPDQFALQIDCKTNGLNNGVFSSGSIFSKYNEDYYFDLYKCKESGKANGYGSAYLLPLRSRQYLSLYCLCQMTTLIKMDTPIPMLLRFGLDESIDSAFETNSVKQVTFKISLISETVFKERKATS